ncbi:MAG TPA: oxygen-dependent coproporphyrinogen oxidase [Cytophagales bacterium]|jgi:coproporphyrinogen III oxidase|nr:oxygen-dependent coproporphyrinogen oxidase [Cytophagales bacterium]
MKEPFEKYIADLQNSICQSIEQMDGNEKFKEDVWQREGGGGGVTRVISNGIIFEKGGVNRSAVFGEVTPALAAQLKTSGASFFATGISLVIHPVNPMVPTVHANFRYFELYDQQKNKIDGWFGGGADLTPYYLFEEDAVHFHQTFKSACDRFDPSFYPTFKLQCDNYFNNTHRGHERRGVGGIFYDYLRPNTSHDENFFFEFSKACGDSFVKAYLPIVERRKNLTFTDEQRKWQELRRGRYVEFNLIHDRGTIFGLKSNGRTESILMSLPPRVRFEYDDKPVAGSKEEELIRVLKNPREWV